MISRSSRTALLGANNYPDTASISAANHNAVIENQYNSPASLSVVYVDASVAATGNGTISAPYKTIAEALARVTASGTVHVAAGTYAENLNVTKPVTLLGAQAGVDARTRSGSESVIDGTLTGAALNIAANNVVIDGFKIVNSQNGSAAGIAAGGSNSGYVIKNNIITNNVIGVFANCASDCQITKNLFDSNNLPGSAGGSAIYTEVSNGLKIDANDFKNHTTNSSVIFASVALASHQNVTVSNNTFSNNSTGDSVIYAINVSGGAFTGNTIDSGSTGISLSGGNSNIAITSNDISNVTRGVRINNFGESTADNSGVTIHNNKFVNNSEYGVANLNAYVGNVDATDNWWGASSGPKDHKDPSWNS